MPYETPLFLAYGAYMTDWLYQIRIVVTSALSKDLRSRGASATAKKIIEIAKKYEMQAVCTYDAFKAYCEEAERNGLDGYSLYNWTKATLADPDKREKHQTSFAFYRDNDQIYPKDVAETLYQDLRALNSSEILDVKIIDSNPENNPQPPQ